MDIDLRGFLLYHKKDAGGLVSTDAGRSLTDEELRAYCIWGCRMDTRPFMSYQSLRQ